MSEADHGEPITDARSAAVDDWSRDVFEAGRDWPLARNGRWFRSDDGYLRLRIDEVDGAVIEPLSVIELETSESRILVDFGSWATPLSGYGKAHDWNAANAVAEARELVEGWLRGDVRLVSYSDDSGWRGSKIIEGVALPEAIEPIPVEIGEGAQVVVKTFRRSGWRHWVRSHDRQWVEQEISLG